jgi:hypothetical protein
MAPIPNTYICLKELITSKELETYRTIFIDFPEIDIYVQLNEITLFPNNVEINTTDIKWDGIVYSEKTEDLYLNRYFDTPGELLNWLMSIDYGIDFSTVSSVLYKRMDAEDERTIRFGHVYTCS